MDEIAFPTIVKYEFPESRVVHCMGWPHKGRVQKKKKNLEFSRFGLTHPPHPCNRGKSGKKNKIFIVLK